MNRIALVAPALAQSGGVGSVADFVRRTIRRRPDLDLKLISLSVSSTDPCSTLLRRPASWPRGVGTAVGDFRGEAYTHVGASLGDIEVQRLKPRSALSELVQDCDLIQVVSGTPCWALPVIGLGKPVVLQTATLAAVERKARLSAAHGALGVWRRTMTGLVARLDDRALRGVDAVLVENQWMQDHAAERAPLVRFAPPGVDIRDFAPLPERDPRSGYILTVGRLADPRKNLGLLIDAYARLVARMNDAPRLAVAGLDALPPHLWERARGLGVAERIDQHLKPTRGELAQLYRSAQSFALASAEEGFGVVLIEAMAAGIPVVSTRSGGPQGIITDGTDGYLVDCDDVEALADRLFRLASSPDENRRMGDRARRTAVETFSEDVTGDLYLQTYDELLGRHHAARFSATG